jgi:predicted nucleotidyltransferase
MDENDRILALEAALTACEGHVPSEFTAKLRAWLDNKIEQNPDLQEFGLFLDKQREAVRKLAENPQMFGG